MTTSLLARYSDVRGATERLAAPLSPDDCQAASLPDASPVKWHLAHTTWFFETFCLGGGSALFNSYYESLGDPLPHAVRPLLTRPTLDDVLRRRAEVDAEIARRMDLDEALLELGLRHEEQHQELILTDLKHLFASNPARPVYAPRARETADVGTPPIEWLDVPGGLAEIGADGTSGFSFDHERPRHRRWLEPFALASRAVSCGEYLEFIADGGYARPELWLADGWEAARREGWDAPLYWRDRTLFTLAGTRPLDPREAVCHVSAFEADAYARWAGARLPTEEEWELAAATLDLPRGAFLESGRFHPSPIDGPRLLGDVWEWTSSAYGPYPGYRPPAGALGEYNGKFMSGRLVLRGGSCATPEAHVSATYRNYFPPATRWQFSGIRLARDA